ncbi:MAG TPA: hypothetical protein VGL17_12820, partial [Gemmatimonadaceae bacterium]
MRCLVVIALAGCAHSAVATPRTPESISSDTHALLEAYDRGDATGFGAATAATFVHFEGHVHDRASELAEMKPHPPYVAR